MSILEQIMLTHWKHATDNEEEGSIFLHYSNLGLFTILEKEFLFTYSQICE